MPNSSGNFSLSASLSGHGKDVRAVCFPTRDFVCTSSRDGTVQVWNKSTTNPPTYSATRLADASCPFNSLAYIPPSEKWPEYPKGLVLAGSQDQTIQVLRPDADVSTDPGTLRVLSGHSSNVSTIDVSPNGEFIVSGDWDGQVKLWKTGTWEAKLELCGPAPEDKQRAIWAVLAYSNTIVVTGSADHVIRGYYLQDLENTESLQAGMVIRTPDVVRALSRVRKHPSGAKIASAGNDFLIRLWLFNGAEVGVLRGHESFIYALDSLPTGELISSSEDRTVRVWKGTSCTQTITHPALSIWSVSVCQQTGDFATGASDNIARIFTRNHDRVAPPLVLQEFSKSVQKTSIPRQQVDDVDLNTLPGPEFIKTNDGTKEGQTIMINSGSGNISVYQWSLGQNQWLLVGTVVDSSAAERNTAKRDSMEKSADVIETNKYGLSHPLDANAVFASLVRVNFNHIRNRIKSMNNSLYLNAVEIEKLESLVQTLEKDDVAHIPTTVDAIPYPSVKTSSIASDTVALVVRIATVGSYECRLPMLDLLRCMAVSSELAKFIDEDGHNVLDLLLPKTMSPEEAVNNTMMVLRLITNLFITVAGGQLVVSRAAEVVTFISQAADFCPINNRNLMMALVSAVNNIASFAHWERSVTGHFSLDEGTLVRLIKVLAMPILDLADTEVVYRSLVAMGNLVVLGIDHTYTERVHALNAEAWVSTAMDKIKEDRIQSIGLVVLEELSKLQINN